ncbi:adenine phosphoribosyltransferase [Schumannella luteola]|uniref:Adenine phosphoribosyltransferase n=1 Tax=Schumannella luteola TaxID=472059 RepID=A0A852Y5C1_9MICO|nr:adenine phosphoribosyltransferase [Schumannella luteola]NYG97433.1 adenine phosphoribosyltransferase [Schumannella luteola]TPX01676.1 adenine phosphoribosyltransferase [Schumannella luteola]
MSSAADLLRALMRETPDFPEPGVLFRDLTPVLADGVALAALADELAAPFGDAYDVVAGLEARGFPLAAAIAARTGRGMLLVRKAGKLPGPVLSEDYGLEYGTDVLELRADLLPAGTRVLVVDDVLATGGTVAAAHRLIRAAGWTLAGTAVALELAELGGRARVDATIHAVLTV